MAKQYVPPTEVTSPHRHWTLVSVICEGVEGGSAAAIGRWDGDHVLAMRWNGKKANPLGNPQSRGVSTWFIIPDKFREPILKEVLKESPGKRALVEDFFRKR